MTVRSSNDSRMTERFRVATDLRLGWLKRNRAAVARHLVINVFLIIILLPLAWVLLMSVKTLPDAMRGDFLPRRLDFSHYSFVIERIVTLPTNLFNSAYVTISS